MAGPSEAGHSAIHADSVRLPWAWMVFLVAVRMAVVAVQPFLADHVPEWKWSNNDGYDTLAIHWMETGVYALERGEPTALRLPLYPALISAAVFTCGPVYPFAVMALQAGLSIWTGILLFRMTSGLFGRKSGLLALTLFLVHPQVNLFVIRCATETLFVFLVVAFLHEAVRFSRTFQTRPLVWASVAMGLSLLTRQTLAPLAWMGGVALLVWSLRRRSEIRHRMVQAGVAIGVVFLILAPWLARNRIHSGGDWVLQTWVGQPLCQGAYVTRHLDEFLEGRKTLTELDQACLAEIQVLEKRFVRTLPPGISGISREVATDRYFRNRVREQMSRSPMDRTIRFFRNLLWAPVLQMTWKSTCILMLCNWPVLLLGGWGVALWLRMPATKRREGLPVLVVFGYLYACHAATWPQARYILPGLVPFLAFSGVGLERVWTLFRRAA